MSTQTTAHCASNRFWIDNPYQPPRYSAPRNSIWSEFTPDTIGMLAGGIAGLYFGMLIAQVRAPDAHWLDQFVWADFGYAIGSFSGGVVGASVQLARWLRGRRQR